MDGDGQPELVCNIGRSPDFACIRSGSTIAWRTTCSSIKGKTAYSPQKLTRSLDRTDKR